MGDLLGMLWNTPPLSSQIFLSALYLLYEIPDEGTLQMPEWMIDEILQHLDILSYQLVKSQALGLEPVEELNPQRRVSGEKI